MTDETKRIMHVVADGTPGGGTTFVLALVEALARLRQEKVVVGVVSQQDSYLLTRAQELGAKVFGLDFFRSRVNPLMATRLGNICQAFGPDMVHAHGGRAAFSLSFLPRRQRKWRFLYTVHGYHFRRRPIGFRLGAAAERLIGARADTIIFVSEADQRIAQNWRLLPANGSSQVIRNAIDVGSVPVAREKTPRLIAFSGRLTTQKDPLLFVEIARELAPEGYSFVMLGSGELEGEVRQRAAALGLDSVLKIYTGLSREAALAILRRASACVLTSRWEGLPLVALEAMVMGVPVIAPRIDGIAEIFEEDCATSYAATGLLVEKRDPREFADAIRKLTDDHDLRTGIERRARAHVLNHFSYHRFLAEYGALYGLSQGLAEGVEPQLACSS